MRSFIREKKIHCGANYMEVDIFRYTDVQNKSTKGRRSRKKIESVQKQKNLNDKNAKRHFGWKVNANFGQDDYHVNPTYNEKFKPETIEEAEKIVKNYLGRIAYHRKKLGLSPLKYMLVTECIMSKDNPEENVRIHHHIIMNNDGMDRSLVEDLWRLRKKKGQKKGESLGYVNADRLQVNEEGLNALCNYLTKYPKRKKRWSCSQNLINPWSRTNDRKYSRKALEQMARNVDAREIEKRYPGWRIAGKNNGIKAVYNEYTGWSLYLKFYKEESIE